MRGLHHGADGGRDRAVLVVVDAAGDVGALFHAGSASIASVDDRLESVLVPTRDEVTVRAVASVITVRQNEGLRLAVGGPPVLERGGVPVNLVEEMGDVDPTSRASL